MNIFIAVLSSASFKELRTTVRIIFRGLVCDSIQVLFAGRINFSTSVCDGYCVLIGAL